MRGRQSENQKTLDEKNDYFSPLVYSPDDKDDGDTMPGLAAVTSGKLTQSFEEVGDGRPMELIPTKDGRKVSDRLNVTNSFKSYKQFVANNNKSGGASGFGNYPQNYQKSTKLVNRSGKNTRESSSYVIGSKHLICQQSEEYLVQNIQKTVVKPYFNN